MTNDLVTQIKALSILHYIQKLLTQFPISGPKIIDKARLDNMGQVTEFKRGNKKTLITE